ncbi:MAG: thermonuclease family protein [Kangiellaceae bacterium]|nr:thermonuclease family protein [Kangiellaceae bacterium]
MLLKSFSKKTLFSVFFIALNLCLFLTSSLSAEESCPRLSDINPAHIDSDKVDWIPDGDTIHTEQGLKLRLLHINTPEINPKLEKPAEPFAISAQQELKRIIGDSKKISWTFDKKARDRYKRSLVHTFNQQGELLTAKLVEQGLAKILVIPPNDRYWRCLKSLESKAIKSKRGLWSLPTNSAKSAHQAKPNNGHQWIRGKISRVFETNKNRWMILDNSLWVGISKKRLKYFDTKFLSKQTGDTLSLTGYVYRSKGKLRIKLKHPAMLMPE